MKQVKTSELQGAALDWAVAKVEGLLDKWGVCAPVGFKPSTDWAQGGPIIERELVAIDQHWLNLTAEHPGSWEWSASIVGEDPIQTWINGPTPLIAAMRCYVASKLGDVVSIPEELL